MEKAKMIYYADEIRSSLTDNRLLIADAEKAFAAYSKGECQIPPVGYLAFPECRGDTHIKYGHIKGDDCFVVKIASGFADNSLKGIPVGSGIVLVFSALTGVLQAILADEGYLTDLRTAIAGAICAKYLAPSRINAIGIIGTGVQARMQLSALKDITDQKKVYVYGRNPAHVRKYISDMRAEGFDVSEAKSPAEAAVLCNLIITTTSAKQPLLYASDIRPGTHITAVGADAPGKNEIDSSVFAAADIITADSKSQCIDHGDISHAVGKGAINADDIIELGRMISEKKKRTDDEQITVSDLTGVAVQDIAIAKAALRQLAKEQ